MDILVLTNGSDQSRQAARAAARLFAGAEFSLLSVVDAYHDPLETAGGIEGPAISEEQARSEYRASRLTGAGAVAATASEFGGLPVTEYIVEDTKNDISTTLVSWIRDHDVDVVVVGARGHGRLHDLVFGSVSKKVARRSPKPVLVVRPVG